MELKQQQKLRARYQTLRESAIRTNTPFEINPVDWREYFEANPAYADVVLKPRGILHLHRKDEDGPWSLANIRVHSEKRTVEAPRETTVGSQTDQSHKFYEKWGIAEPDERREVFHWRKGKWQRVVKPTD